jgi:hypothetical protein
MTSFPQIILQEKNVVELKNPYQVLLHDIGEIFRQILKEELAKLSYNQGKESKKTEYLTRGEVKDLLRISLTTLNDYTKRGILNAYQIGGRILYRLDEIQDAVEKVEQIKYGRSAS